MAKQVVKIVPNQSGQIEISEAENLLFNMMAGLLPENLTRTEVRILINKYGEKWFERLGYSITKYKKPSW